MSFPKGITNLISIICYSFFLTIINTSCSAQTTSQKVVEIDAQEVTYRNQKFDVVKIDLRKTPVQFFWKNKNGKLIRSLENLKKESESDGKELLFGMNAGMYQLNRNPQGLYIENGKTVKSLDTLQDGYGNFYLQPNGVFYLKLTGKKENGIGFRYEENEFAIVPNEFDLLIFSGKTEHIPLRPDNNSLRISINMECMCEESIDELFKIENLKI